MAKSRSERASVFTLLVAAAGCSCLAYRVRADASSTTPVFIYADRASANASERVDIDSLCDRLNSSASFVCASRWGSGAAGTVPDIDKLRSIMSDDDERRWTIAYDSELMNKVYDVVSDETPRSFDGYFSFENSIPLFQETSTLESESRSIASTLRTPKRSDRAASRVTVSGSRLSRKASAGDAADTNGGGVVSSIPLDELRIADNFAQGNSTSRTMVVQHEIPELGSLSAYAGGCLRPCRAANNFYFASAGSNVTVYVIDTPIADHVQFKQVQTGESRLVIEEFVSVSASAAGPKTCSRDLGTHAAAAMGGFEFGTAKDADIVSVGVVPGCGASARVSDLLAGLDWMHDHYVSRVYPDSAIALMSPYLSARDPASEAIVDSVRSLDGLGIAFVATAGDTHRSACDFVPPNMPNVLTVGGVTVDATSQTAKPWAWTNYGRCVDLFAPAYTIRSASPVCFECSATLSRTATAAARVAGLMAQYAQSDTNATSAAIKNAILQASTRQMIREQQFPYRQTTRNVAQSLLSLSVFEVRDVVDK